MNEGSIAWNTKKMKQICLSTMEAEYYQAVEAGREIEFIRNLEKELDIPQTQPTILYEDIQAAIAQQSSMALATTEPNISLSNQDILWSYTKRRSSILFISVLRIKLLTFSQRHLVEF
jgi:hypothetical protein